MFMSMFMSMFMCMCAGESKRLLDSLQALQLQTGSVTRGLKEAISARERQLVEHDVLKLQVGLQAAAPHVGSTRDTTGVASVPAPCTVRPRLHHAQQPGPRHACAASPFKHVHVLTTPLVFAPRALQVQRLRDVLCMSADQVHTLESRKAHLQLSLDEQRHQIEVHRDSLRSEMRLLKDDMHRWGGVVVVVGGGGTRAGRRFRRRPCGCHNARVPQAVHKRRAFLAHSSCAPATHGGAALLPSGSLTRACCAHATQTRAG
jgi:hypothetical protein